MKYFAALMVLGLCSSAQAQSFELEIVGISPAPPQPQRKVKRETPFQVPVIQEVDLQLKATPSAPLVYPKRPKTLSPALPEFSWIKEALPIAMGKPTAIPQTRYEAAVSLATYFQKARIATTRQMSLCRALLKELRSELTELDFPVSLEQELARFHVEMIASGVPNR